jgi:predicted CopG family antitoxin
LVSAYPLRMATKNIAVTTEAYQALSRLKRNGQSFSQVIVKHIPRTLPKTCGELLDELERDCEGRVLSDPNLMKAVRLGRGRRSNRPARH